MKIYRGKLLQVMMAMLIVGSMAETGMPHSCVSTFFSALVQLIPCRASVRPYSPIPPSDTCCSAIRALGQPCLCVLVNGPPISGVDRSMALMLPDKCMANFGPCKVRWAGSKGKKAAAEKTEKE